MITFRPGQRIVAIGAGMEFVTPRGGLTWLLRDEFTTALPAGSVNGTAAEPGPGTRVVVDTGLNLAITGGQVVVTGQVAIANPGFWHNSVARATGRILLQNIYNQTETLFWIGYDNNQSGAPPAGTYWFAGPALRCSNGNIPVAVWAPGQTYTTSLVLKATGYYILIKGGAFTNWTLLWIQTTDTTDPFYSALVTNGVPANLRLGFVRVPDELWTPTPLAYDTFDRADGALGNSETTGPDGQSVTARAWNNRVGTTQVASNKAQATALVGGIAIATVDTGTTSVVMQATLTRAGGNVGVVLRYADASNYVYAYHDGTNCVLVKRVATVETTMISAAAAIGAGAIVVICDGTAFSLYLNNAKVGATSTIADAALQTGTQQGLYTTNVGNAQDVFLNFPRGNGGEYAALDRYSS